MIFADLQLGDAVFLDANTFIDCISHSRVQVLPFSVPLVIAAGGDYPTIWFTHE